MISPRGAPRLLRRLRARIIAVGVLSTAIAIAGFSITLTYLALDATEIRLSDLLRSAMRGPAGAACVQDPAAFGVRGDEGTTLFAYDAKTGASMNPAATQLSAAVEFAAIRPLGVGESLSRATLGTGAVVVTRLASGGPCSLLVVAWETEPAVPLWKRALVFLVFLLILVGVGVIGVRFVVRPTLVRIGRLSVVATNVGDESYQPGQTGDDELGKIEAALDVAHNRIVTDAADRIRRHHALAEHLEHVAHDLKTPIASLQLKLERLANALDRARVDVDVDGEADALAPLVTQAMEDAVYMAGLSNNLQLAARLHDGLDPSAPAEEGAPRPEVDLGDVVERVGARVAVLAQRKDISLQWARPDAPCVVRCQPTMATQLVQNLVQNAVAYNDRAGHVAVVLETSNGAFDLRVVDDGPGVPPEDLPRLIGRTFRGDQARARDDAGGGLGLAIASEIATRSGMTLSFEANAPRGLVARLRGSTSS